MLAKCINPACPKRFHYLREGRIFHIDRGNSPAEAPRQSHNVEHFWLCGDCCETMTVLCDPKQGVQVVPRSARHGRRAA